MAHLQDDDNTCGFTIYWRIENFISEPCTDFFVESQVFKIRCLDSNWKMELFFKTNDILSVDLVKITHDIPFNLHLSLYVLTGSGWTTVFHNAKNRFRLGGDAYGGDIIDLNLLKKEEWFYLPNGSLTISFRVWNARIKNESSQRLMISRLINGQYLRHRPIQTFSNLKPNDLFSFPLSYEFPLNPMPKIKPQEVKNWRTERNSISVTLTVGQLADKLINFYTEMNSKNINFQASSGSNLSLQQAKEVKTQHTQTDMNFKAIEQLRKLFKEKEFKLVTLRTPTKEFSVLKAVLCEKSPVFKAMFEREMSENASNVVDIDDINNETLEIFVNFLHFEPLEDLKWEAAISLYYPADKYQIDSLKELCVSLLKKELSIENVCSVLCLADYLCNMIFFHQHLIKWWLLLL